MELRIGLQQAPRELQFETSQSASEIEAQISDALTEGSGVIRLQDSRDRVYLVRADRVLYVEIGSDQTRQVGFIA